LVACGLDAPHNRGMADESSIKAATWVVEVFGDGTGDLLFTHCFSPRTFCVSPVSARGHAWLSDNVDNSRCVGRASPLNDVWTEDEGEFQRLLSKSREDGLKVDVDEREVDDVAAADVTKSAADFIASIIKRGLIDFISAVPAASACLFVG
jgi:hypothetical protein